MSPRLAVSCRVSSCLVWLVPYLLCFFIFYLLPPQLSAAMKEADALRDEVEALKAKVAQLETQVAEGEAAQSKAEAAAEDAKAKVEAMKQAAGECCCVVWW